jgi:hypothetical protein
MWKKLTAWRSYSQCMQVIDKTQQVIDKINFFDSNADVLLEPFLWCGEGWRILVVFKLCQQSAS